MQDIVERHLHGLYGFGNARKDIGIADKLLPIFDIFNRADDRTRGEILRELGWETNPDLNNLRPEPPPEKGPYPKRGKETCPPFPSTPDPGAPPKVKCRSLGPQANLRPNRSPLPPPDKHETA